MADSYVYGLRKSVLTTLDTSGAGVYFRNSAVGYVQDVPAYANYAAGGAVGAKDTDWNQIDFDTISSGLDPNVFQITSVGRQAACFGHWVVFAAAGTSDATIQSRLASAAITADDQRVFVPAGTTRTFGPFSSATPLVNVMSDDTDGTEDNFISVVAGGLGA